VAKQQKLNAEAEPSVSAQIGRIAKIFALYVLKDWEDDGEKIVALKGAGFSPAEIGDMLGKTENNVRVTLSRAKSKP
jgi:DNA-directed RNA polymerase specialized sigma24 family protein